MNIGKMPRRIAVMTVFLAALATGGPREYRESVVRGPGDQVLLCDLDGDRLQDIVLRDAPNLLVFYQNQDTGFAQTPHQVYPLGEKPSVIWPARLAPKTDSLLVMRSEGVTELDFTNRTRPASRRQIISQSTIIPQSLEQLSIAHLPLSPGTGGSAPVILVPVGSDLQVWRRADTWQHAQTLKDALETAVLAPRGALGYDRTDVLTMSLGDVTGDRRDDLIIRNRFLPVCRYVIYTQNQDGLFPAEPALTWTGKWDWSWYCWVDINRDGHVDLIKNTWLQEPWFLPGTLSGKVLVRIYLADERGRLPAEPQQVFRKNDWIDSIPVVDVDGDGCLDLVLGYSLFDSREGFRKALTAKQLDFQLRFHFYRPGAGFPEQPDCGANPVIHLDHVSTDLTYPRRRYFETFVNLQGDFDGDGDRDLLVRDRADQFSVHPFVSRQAGFAENPEISFRYTEPVDLLQVEDLNGDGRSDLVMKLGTQEAFRVFISHTP
ncbi:MAG: VCBS repeat-containing protein [Planctomycetes bacterium]|nr:VCBS repeat-containing protein [Planctomycetota bacterium]